MKIIKDFPLTVREDPDMAIILPDGTRLSARVWLPDVTKPVPAILEYLPYRKSDGTAVRDQLMHPYFAGHGYACLRVDARGCGDSEGLFDDEYSPQELGDGVDIIHWIAAQPWCDGNVGMQGISWGGFNSLQIAALQPEPLKAIISIGSTVDRFADDIHYKGGVQLTENIGWSATVMSWFSMPPDPAIAGAKWRDMWLERLENTPFAAETWVGHSTRDDYWKHGSVCEDYSAIKAATLCMGGLHDGYRNTMSRLVENLSCPVKGVAGPWNHKYPMISGISPSIGYLQEALRWWDHWLKGIDTGVEDDPAYRAYVMDSIAPAPNHTHRSGKWVAEAEWPSANITEQTFQFGNRTLGTNAPFELPVTTALECGAGCGEYFPFGFGPGELPDDQRQDDAISTCFDSAPLDAPCDLLGAPKVSLRLSSDQAVGQVIVRLCDLRPDGTSALISLGLLNLRHRDGFDHVTDMVPGVEYDVSIPLDQCAYSLPAGHRVRVSISSSYWPYVWPEARKFELTLTAGALTLPTRPHVRSDEVAFEEPETATPRNQEVLRASSNRKLREADVGKGHITLRIEADHGRIKDGHNGLITESQIAERWEINKADPASATAHIRWERTLERDDWKVRTVSTTEMKSSQSHYFITQTLTAFEGKDQVFEKAFNAKIPRA